MNTKPEINTKLQEFRKSLGLNQTAFAESLGISQAAIANIESGKRDVSKPVLLKIREVYNLDLYSYGEAPNPTIDNSNIIAIPTHDISAAAGAGVWVDREPEQDVLYFDKRVLRQLLKRDDFSSIHIIHAQGDSMDSGWNQPDDIKDGDLLMVDTSQTTGNNQVFVILVNNRELRVKRLTKRGDTLYITSNNPKYKEEIYRPDDTDIEVKVIGKVVWHGK